MNTQNHFRRNILLIISFVLLLILAGRLFYIQVLNKKYVKLADSQAIRKMTVYPNRGRILDKDGNILVNNRASYDLMVTPYKVKNIDTAYFCRLLHIDSNYFKYRIRRAINRNGPAQATIFMPRLKEENYGRIQENINLFPGFKLVRRPSRYYPYNCGAHIFGYVREVDSVMIRRSNGFYRSGDVAGATGLERTYEAILRGKRGTKYVIHNVYNRAVGSYANGQYDQEPIPGKDIKLALDIKLELLGQKLLKNKIGSIVALNPKTGGVLAMVSSPTYPPGTLSSPDGMGNQYMRLLYNPAKPLFNRAVQAGYPPGSTFKPIDAVVALNEKVITPAYGIKCSGAYFGCGYPLNCAEDWPGHSGNLQDAIAWSCNSYFFDVFRKIVDHKGNPADGLVTWNRYMHAFGLGEKLGIDLTSESKGNIPDTAYYNHIYGKGRWGSCNIVSDGIGQGEILETPLQMANATSIIANKGYYYTPHLVTGVAGNSEILAPFHQKHQLNIPDSIFSPVIQGMREVITTGTGRFVRIPGITLCGKTGTSENPHGKDHSLFVAFAPMNNPKIVVAVVVENAGFGSTYAAPIASLMVEKYLTDSIAAGQRTALMNRMVNTTILPKDVIEYHKAHKKDLKAKVGN